MNKIPLYLKIIIGLVLGIIWALLSANYGLNKFTLNWIDPFGQIFIKSLKFIAIPLVVFSIVSGICGMKNIGGLGRLGLKTLSAYLLTTIFSVSVGLCLVNMIAPGKQIEEEKRIQNRMSYELWVQSSKGNIDYADEKRFLNKPKYGHLIPKNAEIEESKAISKLDDLKDTKQHGPLQFLVDMVPDNIFKALSSNKAMLQIIFFSILFGLALLSIDKQVAQPIISFVDGANAAFLKMIDWIMQAAPFFVFALMAGVMAKMAQNISELIEIFKGLAWYSLTVVMGLALMAFVIYPLCIRFIGNKNLFYRPFFRKMAPAQFLAFSTSSSAATLPVTMHCVEERVGVSKRISSFVLPIGATVNMDGTSLYQAIAVIFLAQLHFIDLTIIQQLSIVLTATLASIGSAAVPSAGLVMLIMVLQSVGLNPMWIAIIFPVDRFLDMCRTTVNVTGDATVCAIIAESEKALGESNSE